MNKELTPLEALEEIKTKYQNDNGLLRRLDLIENALKALEIIKEYFILTSEYGKVSLEAKKIIPENKLNELREVLL